MLSDSITLVIDDDHDGGTAPVELVYSRADYVSGRSMYISGDHSPSRHDTLKFFRTLPKPSGNFPGVEKSAAKFSKTFEVVGVDQSTTLLAPAIVEVSWSLPVGLTEAQQLALRQRVIALLNDEGVMRDFNYLQMV